MEGKEITMVTKIKKSFGNDKEKLNFFQNICNCYGVDTTESKFHNRTKEKKLTEKEKWLICSGIC